MGDVLTGGPGIFASNPFEAVTLTTKLSKQRYAHFPPWTTWRHRTGFRLGFSLFLPINFPKGELPWNGHVPAEPPTTVTSNPPPVPSRCGAAETREAPV